MTSSLRIAALSSFLAVTLIMSSRSTAQCVVPGDDAACIAPSNLTVTLTPTAALETAFSVTTGDVPISAVDVVFAIDRTGSMADEIASVRTNAVSIMTAIRNLVPDSRFGVVSFMDYPATYSYPGYSAAYGDGTAGDVPFMVNQPVTTNLAAVSSAVQGLWLGSGGDGPQDYTRVLYDALHESSLTWREGAKHILIMFGDDATHDLDFAGYNFGGDPGHDGVALTADDLDFEATVQELNHAGMVVIAVDSGSSTRAEATFRGMSVGYAGAVGTNGQYFRLASASQIPQVVENLVGEESRIVHRLQLQVAPPFDTWIDRIEPADYEEVGPNSTVYFDVSWLVPEATSSGEYAFALRAVGDGAFLAYADISITVPADEIITDLGFRAAPDGFSFNNRSTTATWEMFRQYFGHANVEFSNGDHMPTAQSYFDEHYSTSGNGGSCNGFSVAAGLNFLDYSQPSAGEFAMPQVDELSSTGGFADYDDAIAYYQAAQSSRSIATRRSMSRRGTPISALDGIRRALGNGSTGVIAIFHVEGESSAGHALLPYRIVDTENRSEVFVYDSNYRRDNDRRIIFDTDANTWSYQFQDPILWLFGGETWGGDADDHEIGFEPLSMYSDAGVPLWIPVPDAGAALAITVTGCAATLVTDPSGRCVGSAAGDGPRIEAAVPLQPAWAWNPQSDPEGYLLPGDVDYAVQAQADSLVQGVSVLSPSALNLASMAGVGMLGASVSENGLAMQIDSAGASACSLLVARVVHDQSRNAAWAIGNPRGGQIAIRGADDAATLSLSVDGADIDYDLRLWTSGSATSSRPGIRHSIASGSTHTISLADWDSIAACDIEIAVDADGDGISDRRLIETTGTLDVDPNTLNASSNGRFVTAVVQLREPWTGAQFIPASLRLGDLGPVGPCAIGDANRDGLDDIMVKFDRAAVICRIGYEATWCAEVVGRAVVGTDTLVFAALDSIVVVRPGVVHPIASEAVVAGTTYMVEWATPGALGADGADVCCSLDDGQTWTQVADAALASGTAEWVVPNTTTSVARIRVDAVRNGAIVASGVSDAFNIVASPTAAGSDLGIRSTRLFAPWPMPFEDDVTIAYELANVAEVQLTVFDLRGHRIRSLVNANSDAGRRTVKWDGRDDAGNRVAAGVYLLRFEAEQVKSSARIVMVR